jgi:hypothetical protein
VENPYWVRQETGKVQVVKVRGDEDIVNHIGPEPDAVVREGGCGASVGVHCTAAPRHCRVPGKVLPCASARGSPGRGWTDVDGL